MLNPFDGWTIAHGIVGFLSGRIGINRWLFFPIPFGWEVYQLYFHYQPLGYSVGYIWFNSLIDILTCILFYEMSARHPAKHDIYRNWLRLSAGHKGIIAYFLITLGITWLFWDDTFRVGLSEQVPFPQVPLLLGLISPAFAAFIVRTWIVRG